MSVDIVTDPADMPTATKNDSTQPLLSPSPTALQNKTAVNISFLQLLYDSRFFTIEFVLYIVLLLWAHWTGIGSLKEECDSYNKTGLPGIVEGWIPGRKRVTIIHHSLQSICVIRPYEVLYYTCCLMVDCC